MQTSFNHFASNSVKIFWIPACGKKNCLLLFPFLFFFWGL